MTPEEALAFLSRALLHASQIETGATDEMIQLLALLAKVDLPAPTAAN